MKTEQQTRIELIDAALEATGWNVGDPSQVVKEYDIVVDPAQLAEALTPYQAKNDIEKACANDPVLLLVRYADIKLVHQELTEQLAAFFQGLYSQQRVASLLSLQEPRPQYRDQN